MDTAPHIMVEAETAVLRTLRLTPLGMPPIAAIRGIQATAAVPLVVQAADRRAEVAATVLLNRLVPVSLCLTRFQIEIETMTTAATAPLTD